jgi:transposase
MMIFQCVGVDVASDKFDMAVLIGSKYQHKCFTNNKKGLSDFTRWLNKHTNNPWVCMEATGHYSEVIAEYLYEHGVRVSIVNALQIKKFSGSKLARNKNDIFDSKIISEFCNERHPRTFVPRPASQKELRDLTKVLDVTKEHLTRLKNQLESTRGKAAKKVMQNFIKALKKDIADIETKLNKLVQNDVKLKEDVELITSIKGVGTLTAFKVLARTPEISCFSNAKQFAAYIGITPKQNESGKFKGRTTISRIGDGRIRKAFYMAALVAKRFNPLLLPFVERLKLKGKAPKAIICAVMRKLAHLIFGVLKNRQAFNPQFI